MQVKKKKKYNPLFLLPTWKLLFVDAIAEHIIKAKKNLREG